MAVLSQDALFATEAVEVDFLKVAAGVEHFHRDNGSIIPTGLSIRSLVHLPEAATAYRWSLKRIAAAEDSLRGQARSSRAASAGGCPTTDRIEVEDRASGELSDGIREPWTRAKGRDALPRDSEELGDLRDTADVISLRGHGNNCRLNTE
jgi:hypothetical protein